MPPSGAASGTAVDPLLGSRAGDRARAPPRPDTSRRGLTVTLVSLLVVVAALLVVHYVAPARTNGSGNTISVVAAENFWGSLVSQLGGSRVTVLSIVSDPNADPHDYESNTTDATAIANARLVIENGAGYDDWFQHMVAASESPNQAVLNVANLLGMVAGDNPHFWYGAAYVNATVAGMYSDLVGIDPANASYFQRQYDALNASLAQGVFAPESLIRSHFAGTLVASTESIFVYLAASTGLNLISPPAFMNAVSQGNDPPASSVTLFQNQLESGNVGLLVYNLQTVTPLTQQMESIAIQHHVATLGVTETIQPPGTTFQAWMEGELLALENALSQKALGS